MSDLRNKLIRLAYANPDLRDEILPLVKEAAPDLPKVTIYTGGGSVIGIRKIEGYLSTVSKHGINFIPKRGKRERMIMTYYDPFIMVVEGWGKPNPPDKMVPMESTTPGVEVSKGKYRSTDPRWITDFTEGVGKSLRPIVLFDVNKGLQFNRSSIPTE